jgi:2-keto-4-pentenoate hydratase/2-oxohepta-3-ene-1,7-dioic acid hydratase in catechol pathway
MILDCGTKRYSASRIFCVGRNYAAHAAELANPIPVEPIVFMKPTTALRTASETIVLPKGEVHFETELVVLLGDEAQVVGLALGLDLTRRDLQTALKANGHPWERAKAFDGSAPLGPFTPYHPDIHRLNALRFEGYVNADLRQAGNSADMLFPIPVLLESLRETWDLQSGDLIYTGTPEGVGPLWDGDQVEVRAEQLSGASWQVSTSDR